jgi:hypothetical protein
MAAEVPSGGALAATVQVGVPPPSDDSVRDVKCTRLGSTCSKLLWPDLLVGSANLINCRSVTW